MSWKTYRQVGPEAKLWHWQGTPGDWTALRGWYYGEPSAIRQTNEHIGRRELEVYNLATDSWEIARIGDYVVQQLLPSDRFRGGRGWHYRVLTPEQFAEQGWEEAPPMVYLPPGVYC